MKLGLFLHRLPVYRKPQKPQCSALQLLTHGLLLMWFFAVGSSDLLRPLAALPLYPPQHVLFFGSLPKPPQHVLFGSPLYPPEHVLFGSLLYPPQHVLFDAYYNCGGNFTKNLLPFFTFLKVRGSNPSWGFFFTLVTITLTTNYVHRYQSIQNDINRYKSIYRLLLHPLSQSQTF